MGVRACETVAGARVERRREFCPTKKPLYKWNKINLKINPRFPYDSLRVARTRIF